MERYVGTWHIYDMEAWDEEYRDMEVQAYVRIDPNGLGGFQFGLVTGQIDGEIVKDGASERFEFSWAGQDEMEPMSGCGWPRLKGKDRIEGRIKLHLGDSSELSAKRAQ